MNLDQFYTIPSVAKRLYETFKEHVELDNYDIILEPSAGTGSFFTLLPPDKRVGIDIDPKCDGVVKMDFLKFKPEEKETYAVIGNPPFGRVSSIAIEFFNHSATFADVIAFIIPRTFKRISVQNAIDLNFELIYTEDLPLKPCCFEPNMSDKCCFQIWKRIVGTREKIELPIVHDDFIFRKHGPKNKNGQPTPPANADFALKAYGSNCGRIVTDNLDKLSPKSWHWISANNIDLVTLINKFKTLDYSISKDTVRQDSLGKGELIKLYTDHD